jgi:transketolase
MTISKKQLELKKISNNVRRGILDLTFYGSSSHLGGSLSVVEILVTLYFEVMRIDPQNPLLPERDRFILSKGHAAPALYSVLAERGFFPKEELKTFCKNGTRLQKHMDMHKIPGIDASSGSLGQGLSIAIGMALADRMDKKNRFVYVVMGDGELQEGQIWEGAMAAGNLKLDHLIAFVDANQMQVDGFVKDIMNVEPLEDKWKCNNWDVQRINGNEQEQILDAIQTAKQVKDKPHLIIADTVKGKGVDFMEYQVDWHSKGLTEEEYQKAIAQVDAERQRLERGEE